MGNTKLKICVGYHKPSFLLQGDCFVPMWGGKAVAGQVSKDGKGLQETEYQWMKEHCIGDDTGDNISAKNRNYCEATYIYWMWKNYKKLGNPEYIGFLQYRRHFVLNDEYYKEHYEGNIHNLIIEDEFSLDHQYKIGLIEKNLLNVINSYDGIFCVNNTGETVYHYKQNHHSQDIKYWDKALEIIKKDWPQYADAAREYNNGTWHAWSNCFIMKREDFLEYCPFLFDVLAKIDKFAEPEYNNMTPEQMRVPAYVSETLLGVFYKYLQNKKRNFKSVSLLLVKNPYKVLEVMPKKITAIQEKAIPVVFIADVNYIKYTTVAIKSIIDNTINKKFIDIIILEDGSINDATKQKIMSILPSYVSCRFFDCTYYMRKYEFDNFWHDRLNLMPYLKGFIAEILQDYKKAIFLDGDLIVQGDINELYSFDLGKNLIGAVVDSIVTCDIDAWWQRKRNYIIQNNKMKNTDNYFNSGVLLLNLPAIRQFPNFIDKYICESEFQDPARCNHDQDSLNFVLEGKTLFLPMKYNFQCNLLLPYNFKHLTMKARNLIDKNRKDIFIVHYDGDMPKPWKNLSGDFSHLWWKYARQTPFYEEFLQKIFANNVTHYKFNEISKLKRKYQTHRLLSHITFGKLRDKQNERKLNYRKILDNM